MNPSLLTPLVAREHERAMRETATVRPRRRRRLARQGS
jgi:hypothetical protein